MSYGTSYDLGCLQLFCINNMQEKAFTTKFGKENNAIIWDEYMPNYLCVILGVMQGIYVTVTVSYSIE